MRPELTSAAVSIRAEFLYPVSLPSTSVDWGQCKVTGRRQTYGSEDQTSSGDECLNARHLDDSRAAAASAVIVDRILSIWYMDKATAERKVEMKASFIIPPFQCPACIGACVAGEGQVPHSEL